MHLARRTGVEAAQAELDRAAHALAEALPGADDSYSDALESWLALGCADFDERVEQVVDDIGLDVSLDLPMTALSGGQAARVGLAALLAPTPQLVVTVACAYGLLVVVTDTVRVYQAVAGPVVCLTAAAVVPPQWLLLAVVCHAVFWRDPIVG